MLRRLASVFVGSFKADTENNANFEKFDKTTNLHDPITSTVFDRSVSIRVTDRQTDGRTGDSI